MGDIIVYNLLKTFRRKKATTYTEAEERSGGRVMKDARLLFDEIYKRNQAAVLRFITAKCLSISDIDDIYQDTFLNVYRTLCNTEKPIENEEAFVISIAKKSISRYYGLLAKLRGKVSESLSRLPDKKLLEDIPAEVDVEMLVADRDLCDEIFETVSSMSADVQRIVYMFYILDMPIGAIAEELGLRESTVKNRLYGTLERIRRSYKRRETL